MGLHLEASRAVDLDAGGVLALKDLEGHPGGGSGLRLHSKSIVVCGEEYSRSIGEHWD